MLSDGTVWYLRRKSNYLSTGDGYTKLFNDNIGLFSVLNLRSKIFSRGNFHVIDDNGEIIEDDPLTKWINNPNPQQAKFEFLYNHLLYKGLGNNYINVKSSSTFNPNNIDNVQALYNLNQDFIDFSNVEDLKTPFIFSATDLKIFGDITIDYNFRNKRTPIPVKNLVIYNDLPNNIINNNPIRGISRVDSLIPALSNIDENQRSKNLNLHYGGTFAVSNEKKIAGNNTPLDPKEQDDIESNLRAKNTIVTKTPIKSFRIANDLDDMFFDELFAGSMQKITQAYEMNRDVMNYGVSGSTFENQKQAVVQWIQNSIQFEADVFTSELSQYFKYPEQGKRAVMTYDHLPVMQIVEEKRADKMNKNADTLNKLILAGVSLKDALSLLNIELNENMRQ